VFSNEKKALLPDVESLLIQIASVTLLLPLSPP